MRAGSRAFLSGPSALRVTVRTRSRGIMGSRSGEAWELQAWPRGPPTALLLGQKEGVSAAVSVTAPTTELLLCCLVFQRDLMGLETSCQPQSPSWRWPGKFRWSPVSRKKKGR